MPVKTTPTEVAAHEKQPSGDAEEPTPAQVPELASDVPGEPKSAGPESDGTTSKGRMAKVIATIASVTVVVSVLTVAFVKYHRLSADSAATETDSIGMKLTGPFADATRQLKMVVALSASVVSGELRHVERLEDLADKFDETWKERNLAFDAILAYSDSLEAIVSAGNKGRVTASALADSIHGLAETVGVPIPSSPAAIETATDSIKLLAYHIANIRAARSLEDAMFEAHPAVEQIVELVVEDLEDVDDILRLANKLAEVNIKETYATRISYRYVLRDFVQNADITDVNEAVLEKRTQMNALLDSTNSWYNEYQRKLEESERRWRLGGTLIRTAEDSLQQWVTAHGQVVSAIRNHRPVDMESLLEAPAEIQRLLVEKIRQM
jgi:hypothetical protein